ncbi:MAG: hypothetical protein Q4B54_05840 [Coriobacteriales bacterium]|nr:hypothetical protein [Coriobacteriales bacterium]
MNSPAQSGRHFMFPSQPAGGNRIVTILLCLVSSMLFSSYVTSFWLMSMIERQGEGPTSLFAPEALPVLAITLGISLLLSIAFWTSSKPFAFVVRYRYPLAALLLIALVAFKVSGSSVALMNVRFGEDGFEGVLFGIPRSMRSDEWAVMTPFANAQVIEGFPVTSGLIRGGGTDMTMVYAQPAWAPATLFRPFLWGYMVLGFERGLSFYWCARLIVLALVSFECARLFTNRNDGLSALAAMLVSCSPLIQWWFAVNGTAELFIFGQGLVLCLNAVLRSPGIKRWGLSALLGWLIGCYAFILYPAWQICLFYVFAALGIWVVVRFATDKNREPQRLLSILVPLIVCVGAFVALCGWCLMSSWDTISQVMGTVYPGKRTETGGGVLGLLPFFTVALPSATQADQYFPNVCEAARFFALFPLGLGAALALVAKRRDAGLICLLAAYALLGIYGIFGFPPFLAKITLLSNVTPNRLALAFGYMDVLLLVRSLSLRDELAPDPPLVQSVSERRMRLQTVPSIQQTSPVATTKPASGFSKGAVAIAVVLAMAYAAVVSFWGHNEHPEIMTVAQTAITLGTCLLGSFFVLAPQGLFKHWEQDRGKLLIISCGTVLAAGLLVNPVQIGAESLTNSEFVRSVAAVSQTDEDALWMGDDSVMAQAMVSAGAATINTVNVYPNLELWKKIDASGQYADVYNRYAHIQAQVGTATSFELIQPDMFCVTLTPEDLVRLGVDYFVSQNNLTTLNTPTVSFVPVATAANTTIYRVSMA